MLLDPAKRAHRHVERAILLVEAARRLDLGHLGASWDIDADAALDELLLVRGRLFEVDPGAFVGNALGLRVNLASLAAGSVHTQHGRSASGQLPIFASGIALPSLGR